MLESAQAPVRTCDTRPWLRRRGRSCHFSCSGDAICDDGSVASFDHFWVELFEFRGSTGESRPGRFGKHSLSGLTELLQPLREVDRVADDGVLDAFVGAQ